MGNDSKYGQRFTRVAELSGVEVLRTPCKAPKANAFCERFLGSVRRECLDHVLILSEKHLHKVIREYVQYYNTARPHQGTGQRIPEAVQQRQTAPPGDGGTTGKIGRCEEKGGGRTKG